MKKILLLIILVLGITPFGSLHAETINIGTDASRWYPYTYEENGEAKGIHIDMVREVMKNLGHTAVFTPLPWKRCLKLTEVGEFNAIVSASYKPKRAEYLRYPPDAASSSKSKWRTTQVEYVVVSYANSKYVFEGDLATLPRPVRAPLGYSIVDDLKAKGINVVTAPNFTDNMRALIQSKRGVVITPPLNAEVMHKDPRFSEQFRVHETPVASKSYYMPFSKKNSGISEQEMGRIWEEIARLRDNTQYMLELTTRYQ